MKIFPKKMSMTFIRWALVGITSLLLDVGGFAIGFEISQSIFLANFMAAVLSTTFNYLTHYFWTFKSKNRHGITLPKYYVSIFFLWIASSILIQLLFENGFSPVTAKILSLALILPFNYLILKFFVYKQGTREFLDTD